MNLNVCDMCNKFQFFEKQKQDLGSLKFKVAWSKETEKFIHLSVQKKKIILAYFSFPPQNI